MHRQISEQTGARVFFCDAHSPWQRGSNENMNGLLRDYFPKAPPSPTTSPTSTRSPTNSTTDPAPSLDSSPHEKHSQNYSPATLLPRLDTAARYIHVHATHVEDAWVTGHRRVADRWKGLAQ